MSEQGAAPSPGALAAQRAGGDAAGLHAHERLDLAKKFARARAYEPDEEEPAAAGPAELAHRRAGYSPPGQLSDEQAQHAELQQTARDMFLDAELRQETDTQAQVAQQYQWEIEAQARAQAQHDGQYASAYAE